MKNFNQAVERYFKNDATYIKYFNKCFGNKPINQLSKENLADARSGIKNLPVQSIDTSIFSEQF